MSLRSFLSGKRASDFSHRSPAVRALLQKTLAYLRQRSAADPQAEIRPAMLALHIGENELIALTALELLQDAGVTRAHLGLYCAASMQPVGQVEPGQVIPEVLACDACGGESHDLDQGSLRKELFFTLNADALSDLKVAA